jgi:hypothetical protein
MGAAPIHSKKKMKTLTALNQKLLKLQFLGRNALKPLGKSLRKNWKEKGRNLFEKKNQSYFDIVNKSVGCSSL